MMGPVSLPATQPTVQPSAALAQLQPSSKPLPQAAALRAQAQQALKSLAWPNKGQASWRLALPERLPQAWTLATDAKATTSPTAYLPQSWLWQANGGQWQQQQLSPEQPTPAMQGAYIGPIADYPQPLSIVPGQMAASNQQLLWALNGAHCPDILLIVVPAHTKLSQPIELCWQQDASEQVVLPRIHVLLQAGAQATILTRHSQASQLLCQTVMECHLAAGASLEHIELAPPGDDASHRLSLQSYHLQQDARLQWTGVLAGGHLHRHDCQVHLQGQGSNASLGAVLLGQQRQAVQLHTHVCHHGQHTSSEQHINALIAQQARGLYTGHVQVIAGADFTNARQRSRNLLLDPLATMVTEPQLTIDTDQVQCSHGATIAGLDPEQCFYLQSRGFSAAMAKQWLVQAFAKEALTGRHSPELETVVHTALSQWLTPQTPSP